MSVAWAWSQRALEAIRQLAREWLVSEDAMNALGNGDSQGENSPGESVSDTSHMIDIVHSDEPFWTEQGAQGSGLMMSSNVDGAFWFNEEVDLQGWMGSLFTEPDFPGDCL
jgi:hypothetical protein